MKTELVIFWRFIAGGIGFFGCWLLECFLYQLRFPCSFTYWRERDCEVDFVIARGTRLWGIEVKGGRGGKTSGLEAFRYRYHEDRLLVVGGNGIPLEEFFATPAALWLNS